jgi:histidine kinase
VDLFQQAADALKILFSEKKVELDSSSLHGKTILIQADAMLVVDVFRNLLENAVKFNDKEQKKVTVTADIKKDKVVVQIQDNGTGIPSEEREKVFQKFYQVEDYFTGQVPGAGLGLAFCKKVVEEMGGEIKLTSTLKKGTSVSVSFKLGTK